MVPLLASFLVAAALSGATPQARQLVAGPVLAGDRVVWGEQRDSLSVLRAANEAAPLWQSGSSWFSGPLSASGNLVAFSRSFNGCPGEAGVVCPVETQPVAGSPRRSLRPLAPAERCMIGGSRRRLSVSGVRVAYLGLGCASSSYTVSVTERGRVAFRHAASCCDVSLAGDYLAFRSGDSVDLFDLRTRRLVSRTGPLPNEPIAAFDVQADGKLAVVLGPAADGRSALAWRTAGSATLHRLRLRVVMPSTGPAVRVAGDRVVVVAPGFGTRTQLVTAGLQSGVHAVARFTTTVEQVGGIDATGTSVTWASRQITSTRVDCPPPGQGRPCRLLKSGVETVWLAGLTTGLPRVAARWAYENTA